MRHFGTIFALERARLLLEDHSRMTALVIDTGRDEILLVEPATPGKDRLYTWVALRKQGERLVRARKPEEGDAPGTVDRLRDVLEQGQSGFRMVLASRTGGEVLESSRGRVRRRSLDSREAAAAVAEMRGTGTPSVVPPQHAGYPDATVDRRTAAWLDPVLARPLLEAIGIAGPGGRVRRDRKRKYNQIVHLVGLLGGMLERLPEDRELLVVDCGCGKSQLLFVLNYVLTEHLSRRAHLVGIDSEPKAVDAARSLQRGLGYRNMEFQVSTIRSWPRPDGTDLVLSLHACDTATDEALALGIVSGAQAIVSVPCCQRELATQLKYPELDAVLRHATLRMRFGDWLTDGLRALILESYGYDVDVTEYVSPLDTPKNILIRAELGASRDERRMAAARAHAETIIRDFGVDPSLPRLIEALR